MLKKSNDEMSLIYTGGNNYVIPFDKFNTNVMSWVQEMKGGKKGKTKGKKGPYPFGKSKKRVISPEEQAEINRKRREKEAQKALTLKRKAQEKLPANLSNVRDNKEGFFATLHYYCANPSDKNAKRLWDLFYPTVTDLIGVAYKIYNQSTALLVFKLRHSSSFERYFITVLTNTFNEIDDTIQEIVKDNKKRMSSKFLDPVTKEEFEKSYYTIEPKISKSIADRNLNEMNDNISEYIKLLSANKRHADTRFYSMLKSLKFLWFTKPVKEAQQKAPMNISAYISVGGGIQNRDNINRINNVIEEYINQGADFIITKIAEKVGRFSRNEKKQLKKYVIAKVKALKAGNTTNIVEETSTPSVKEISAKELKRLEKQQKKKEKELRRKREKAGEVLEEEEKVLDENNENIVNYESILQIIKNIEERIDSGDLSPTMTKKLKKQLTTQKTKARKAESLLKRKGKWNIYLRQRAPIEKLRNEINIGLKNKLTLDQVKNELEYVHGIVDQLRGTRNAWYQQNQGYGNQWEYINLDNWLTHSWGPTEEGKELERLENNLNKLNDIIYDREGRIEELERLKLELSYKNANVSDNIEKYVAMLSDTINTNTGDPNVLRSVNAVVTKYQTLIAEDKFDEFVDNMDRLAYSQSIRSIRQSMNPYVKYFPDVFDKNQVKDLLLKLVYANSGRVILQDQINILRQFQIDLIKIMGDVQKNYQSKVHVLGSSNNNIENVTSLAYLRRHLEELRNKNAPLLQKARENRLAREEEEERIKNNKLNREILDFLEEEGLSVNNMRANIEKARREKNIRLLSEGSRAKDARESRERRRIEATKKRIEEVKRKQKENWRGKLGRTNVAPRVTGTYNGPIENVTSLAYLRRHQNTLRAANAPKREQLKAERLAKKAQKQKEKEEALNREILEFLEAEGLTVADMWANIERARQEKNINTSPSISLAYLRKHQNALREANAPKREQLKVERLAKKAQKQKEKEEALNREILEFLEAEGLTVDDMWANIERARQSSNIRNLLPNREKIIEKQKQALAEKEQREREDWETDEPDVDITPVKRRSKMMTLRNLEQTKEPKSKTKAKKTKAKKTKLKTTKKKRTGIVTLHNTPSGGGKIPGDDPSRRLRITPPPELDPVVANIPLNVPQGTYFNKVTGEFNELFTNLHTLIRKFIADNGDIIDMEVLGMMLPSEVRFTLNNPNEFEIDDFMKLEFPPDIEEKLNDLSKDTSIGTLRTLLDNYCESLVGVKPPPPKEMVNDNIQDNIQEYEYVTTGTPAKRSRVGRSGIRIANQPIQLRFESQPKTIFVKTLDGDIKKMTLVDNVEVDIPQLSFAPSTYFVKTTGGDIIEVRNGEIIPPSIEFETKQIIYVKRPDGTIEKVTLTQ